MKTSFIRSGQNMKRAIFVALGTSAIIFSATAFGIAAATGKPSSLSHSEYLAALQGAESVRQALQLRCEALHASERELCRAQAVASEMVRTAEIENDYRRTRQAARSLQRAHIDARYHVERARCSMQSGFRRDKCLIQIHATRGRALLDAAAPYEVRYSP